MARLAIEISSDAADAVRGMGQVGNAATAMGDEVERASRAADQAVGRIDSVGASADVLDSKAGKATGALGALSSGFELVGAEKYAGGLQAAALATDFLSGAGQALTLITEGTALATAKSTIANIAHGTAAKATAAGQWLLNAALSANPIGLLVIGIAAAVAAFVLLYKRSSSFRELISTVGDAGKAALGWIVDGAGVLIGFFKDKLPAAAGFLKDKVVDAFQLITAPQRKMIELLGDFLGFLKDKIPGALDTFVGIMQSAGDKFLAPFRALKDFIDGIIEAIKKIKIPDVNPFSREATFAAPASFSTIPSGGGSFSSSSSSSGGGTVLAPRVTVSGIVGNSDDVIAAIAGGLDRYYRRFGQ